MPTQPTGSEQPAADPVGTFFGGLADAGHLATFEGQSATVRLDVASRDGVESWHLTVSKGDIDVTREDRPADAVIRVDRPQAQALVTGRLNAQAAILRGALACEGKMAAVMMFQRCLPGPPGSTGTAAPITGAAVMARIRAEQASRA